MTDMFPAVTLNTAAVLSVTAGVATTNVLLELCSTESNFAYYMRALNTASPKYSKSYKWKLHFLQYLRRHLPPTAEKHLHFLPL